MPAAITNIFVLMLENRSFDHMLGFSQISGKDAATGEPTDISGLTGQESNSYRGATYQVTQPASAQMPVDPGHEFLDVLEQLCGTNSAYPVAGAYPPIGFVSDYAFSHTPARDGAQGRRAPRHGEFRPIRRCSGKPELSVA